MSFIIQPEIVHYVCHCGLLKPISKLYFCRHCLQMRCAFCVCHEVDSHFCGKCLENIPSTEARLKKNRCSNCNDCPVCQHQLTIRVSNLGQRTTDPKTTPKKVHYLTCLFCRWNTRDVGIPDQSVPLGGWPKKENVFANRILSIQEKYKGFLLWERQQKLDIEKRKHVQRGKYTTLTDKTGLHAAAIRKKIGLPDLNKTVYKPFDKEVAPAKALDQIEKLNDKIFTEPLNLHEITSLEQRFMQPDWQSPVVDVLFPLQKHLSVKQSLRCRTCEHNVSKPEYNPNSIKFKIQLFAYYHIPEIRIVTCEPLKAGEVCDLVIRIINPTQHQTTITFSPLELDEEASEPEKSPQTEVKQEDAKPSISRLLSSPLSRQPSVIVEPRPIDVTLTGSINLPDASVIIPARDDAAEYDDSVDVQHFQDDPKLVVWRRSNKVALKLKITPNKDLNEDDKVVIGLTMEHIYISTITTTESKEPIKYKHKVKVVLNVGKLLVAKQ